MRGLVVLLFHCGVLLRLFELTYSQSGSCNHGDIRLAGGSTYLEGRVEVCFRDQWGTVCDDGWEEPDANVACGQLGFSNQGAMRFDGPVASDPNAVRSPFGEGSGNIVFEELQCTGNESSLFQCLRRSRCEHTEDAGLRCQSRGVTLVRAGQLLPNNSLLSLDDINDTSIVSCTTDQQSSNSLGNWFPPTGNDTVVEESSLSSPDNSSLLQSRNISEDLQLVRPGGTVDVENGLYRCEIPDKDNVTQTLFVGIYSDEMAGGIESVSVTYDNTSQTFTCTSSGGPATSVTWTLDNSTITVDGIRYESSQVVINTSTATYENRLRLVAKSASLSGTYRCSVGNTAGTASGSATISVCRDGEVRRMVDGASTLEICVDDEWLALTNSLQVVKNDLQVTNIQFEEENGVALSWTPLAAEDILRYDVRCSSTSDLNNAQLTWSLPGDPQTSTSPLPFLLPRGSYTCCVTTVTQGRMGVEFTSTACQDGLLVGTPPTTATPTTCPSCSPTPECSSAGSILVPVLGVLAGLFFVALLIVSGALLLFMRAATSGKRVTYETNGLMEHEMKTSTLPKESTLPRQPSDPLVSNPMYGSSNTVGDNMVMTKEERRKSNASQAASNPMYSTNQEIRRSFNVRKGERVDGVHRSHSSAAALNRKVSPRKKVEMIPPVYTTVVPKDQRKNTRPMSVQDQLPPEQGATGNSGNPLYSDIDQIKVPRPREPTPDQEGEEMGYRGKEPSPLHQSEQGEGAIYSDINPVNGTIPNQLAPPMGHPGPISPPEEQTGLRGKEPSPSPEQVAAEEADGVQAPLYSALDLSKVDTTVSTAPQPFTSEGDDGVAEPLYSSINDPVTPPPRSKTLSVSQTREKSGVGGAKSGVGKAEGGQQDSVPAEDEYATLNHL